MILNFCGLLWTVLKLVLNIKHEQTNQSVRELLLLSIRNLTHQVNLLQNPLHAQCLLHPHPLCVLRFPHSKEQ